VDAKCITCHAQKSETERLCALHRKPLYSELSRDVLEGLFDAPRPKQLVFGDGEPDCLEVDIIGCRVNALVKGEVLLPVADVTHRIEEYDSTCERHVCEGALYFIDAGPPAGQEHPLGIDARGLLYYGPAWYSRERTEWALQYGCAETGKISADDIRYVFCTDFAPVDSLVKPYQEIAEIVANAMHGMGKPYTPDDITKQTKSMLLAMQGLWTQQHSYSWKCINSNYVEDAPGPVHMWRPNEDGSQRLMCRKGTLSNRTMFLIGRAALDYEQVLVWQMWIAMTIAFPRMRVRGCINDCVLVTGVAEDEVETLIQHGLAPDPEALDKRTLDYMWRRKGRRDTQICHWLDGTPKFRVKDAKRMAPPNRWKVGQKYPRPSAWNTREWDAGIQGFANDAPDDVFENVNLVFKSFGAWSPNGSFLFRREWRVETETPGLGCGPNDTYQARMASTIVENRGAYISGHGGSGKTWLIKLIVQAFVELGFREFDEVNGRKRKPKTIHKCGFTHVAAGNIDGRTLLHELHRTKKKGHVIIVDEASMVPLSMWSALLNLKFTGNIIIVAGDMDGQFQPIADQHQLEKLEGFDRSDFMHDLCNGLRVEMVKYRRGKGLGFDHFTFTGRLYPQTGISLAGALQAARHKYPASGHVFNGTTLCISHRCRMLVNREANIAAARSDAVFVEAGQVAKSLANQPQNMLISVGMVLMAVCSSNEKVLKNGLRYKVLSISTEKTQCCHCTVEHLYCGQHFEGPLDVWYDCEACWACDNKELSLKRMRWLTTAEFNHRKSLQYTADEENEEDAADENEEDAADENEEDAADENEEDAPVVDTPVTFELALCDDDDAVKGAPFMMDATELGAKMRMSYAITYFSCQARTLSSGVRLAQTDSERFTLRHLVVGLGRAPTGDNVQVE